MRLLRMLEIAHFALRPLIGLHLTTGMASSNVVRRCAEGINVREFDAELLVKWPAINVDVKRGRGLEDSSGDGDGDGKLLAQEQLDMGEWNPREGRAVGLVQWRRSRGWVSGQSVSSGESMSTVGSRRWSHVYSLRAKLS
jgi:hypothetical protein